ncbi:MAG: hypothetical protein ABIJ46_04660 [bacterium]
MTFVRSANQSATVGSAAAGRRLVAVQSAVSLAVMLAVSSAMTLMSSVPAGASPSTADSYGPYSVWSWLVTFGIVLLLLLFGIRSVRGTRLIGAVLSLVVLLGISYDANVLLGPAAAVVSFCLGTAIYYGRPRVVTYDLLLCLGMAGVGAAVGVSLDPTVLLLVLGLLSAYDLAATSLSGLTVRLGRRLLRRRAFFAFIYPLRPNGLTVRVSDLPTDGRFACLDVVDLALPTVFVVSALWHVGPVAGLASAVGGLIGLSLSATLPSRDGSGGLYPTLPTTVLGLAAGYLAAIFIP